MGHIEVNKWPRGDLARPLIASEPGSLRERGANDMVVGFEAAASGNKSTQLEAAAVALAQTRAD